MFETNDERNAFLDKYRISTSQMELSLTTWEVLSDVYTDYKKSDNEFKRIEEEYRKIIQKIEGARSISSRVKAPEHLLEKIIRWNGSHIHVGESVGVSNYRQIIRDLVGIRVLLLFKEDWISFDINLNEMLKGKIVEKYAYIREGDDESFFSGRITIKEHRPYRSVHYIIQHDTNTFIELQVRTLFEEAWGEIDHKVRYPYDIDNALLKEYMKLLSRLVGMADEMSTFINKFIDVFRGYNSSESINQRGYSVILEEAKKIDNSEIRDNIIREIEKIRKQEDVIEMTAIIDGFLEAERNNNEQ